MSNEQKPTPDINEAFSEWLKKNHTAMIRADKAACLATATQDKGAVLQAVNQLVGKAMRMDCSLDDFLKSLQEITQDLSKFVQSDCKDAGEKLLLSPEELSLLRSVAAHRVMEGGGEPSVQRDLENLINAFKTINQRCSCPLSACG